MKYCNLIEICYIVSIDLFIDIKNNKKMIYKTFIKKSYIEIDIIFLYLIRRLRHTFELKTFNTKTKKFTKHILFAYQINLLDKTKYTDSD